MLFICIPISLFMYGPVNMSEPRHKHFNATFPSVNCANDK